MKNVFYKYDYYGTNDAQGLCHRFKENDLVAVKRIASDMVSIMGSDCYLIPIPNKYGHAHQTLSLANLMMMYYPGVEVFDIMKGAERESVYEAKKNGHPLSEADLNFYLTEPVPTGKRIFLVDNVISTGLTATAALRLIPSADMLVHSVDRKVFDRSAYRSQFAGVYLCDGNLQTIYDTADRVTNMRIELKNVKVYEQMSEETTAFVADVYINEVKAGLAKNDGGGGMTFCQAYNPKGQDLISKAEAYCKTLTPTVYPSFNPGDKPLTVPMTFDNYIDDLLSKFLFEKDMKRGILYGKSHDQYEMVEFNHPIDTILKDPKGVEFIKKTVKNITGQLEVDQRILNTNLPEEVMQVAYSKEVKTDLKNASPEKKRTSPGEKNKPSTRKRRPK